MKTTSLILATALALVFAPAALQADVTLTGFGIGEYTPTFTDFTTENQNATTYQLTGTDFGFSAFGDLAAPVNITGSTSSLSLQATFVGTATSSFGIELFDTLGNSRLYSASFASFTQSVSSVVNFSFVSQTGAFNNLVNSVGFSTSGTGSTVNITMDTLTATPEPSATVLIGAGILGLVARRRRVS